ncbi:hypothetical protein [Streptomyces sp. NPDC020141]|uniref:hypothetical protein n=1 Tax=Streptomyces sp. NPDC020141 TaxID=3365065 RepID=UPI0037A39C64
MPRPTAAQLAYGSATVVLSALALLLFTRTTEALGVVVIDVAAMALGLMVAAVLPARAARRSRARGSGAPGARAGREPAGVGERAGRG